MLRTLTAATSTPVGLDDVLAQIGMSAAEAVDHVELLERLIEDAADFVAGEIDQVLQPTDLEERWACWWSGCKALSIGPVRDVEGVYYLDDNGDEQPLDADAWAWEATRAGAIVWLVERGPWPTLARHPAPVRIRFSAGFNDPAATAGEDRLQLPRQARLAVLMLVAHWFRNREAEGERPDGIDRPLQKLRVYR